MFGINGAEFAVLALIALVVVGPERLPAYAEQLGRWVRSLRGFLGTAKERVAEELGEEAKDVDWASLDPRRYDPRRIVREALLDEPVAVRPVPTTPGARRYTSRAAGASAGAGAGAGAGAVGAASGAGPSGPAAAVGPETPSGPGATAPFDGEAT